MIQNLKITSLSGLELIVHPLGARIISLKIPIQTGPKQIVEHYSSLKKYQSSRKYSGAIVGPYANRIKAAKFSLNSQEYTLEKNEGENCLHSGSQGLHLTNWEVTNHTDNEISFEVRKKHLEDGFPGNRTFRCKYSLEEDDLVINFYAKTDLDTVVNLTNHTYFNLDYKADLKNHIFMIDSEGVLELTEDGIPTGKILPAINEYDLSDFQPLDDRIFDNNFIVSSFGSIKLAAAAYCPMTDITLEAYTDQPGIQFYTGNKMFFAFETQHFPDSPNQPSFPSTLVTKDKPYRQTCIYRLNY